MNARPAVVEDLPGVIDVSRHWTVTPPTPECVTALFTYAVERESMFVAEENGRIVGFLCAWVLPHPFNGEPYCNVVAWLVEPAHRQTWAAAGLFRRFLRWISTTHLSMVTISLPVDARIGTLFERAGFELVEYKRTYAKRG